MASVQNHWVEPPDNIGLSNGIVSGDTTIPVWEWGSTHLLEWTTPWEFFNLFLVQDNPPNYEDSILTNVTGIVSFNWTVATDIIDLNLSRICWFKLHTTTSEGDTFFESAAFNISGDPSWPASDIVSTTSPSTPTLISTSASASASIPISTAALASIPTPSTPSPSTPSTASTPSTLPTTLPSSSLSTPTPSTPSQLPIKIALGISISVLLLIGLLTAWKIHRRRRRRRRISLPPKPTDNTTVQMPAEDSSFDVKEMEDSQVHELFSPVSYPELHGNARWEMAA